MPRLDVLCCAALVAVGACSDSSTGSGGKAELDVQLTATAAAPYHGFDEDGAPLVSCDVTFQAVTSGDEGALADWTGAVIRYSLGARTEVVDSLVMTGQEVRLALGEQFGPRELRGTDRRFTSGVPFAVEMQLRYRLAGAEAERSVTARATCAVPQGAPTGAAPSVSGLSVVAPTDGLEPGDTVHVTWTATGSPALWVTGIEVSGAFQAVRRVHGQGRGSITHTATLVVPYSATMSQTVQVRAYAIDPWVRDAASASWTSSPLADRTPPVVVRVRTELSSGEYTTSLQGQYGARDTLTLYTIVQDNHWLAWAEYEFGPQGARGSVPLQAPFADEIRIPLTTEMAGATDFRVRFTDASGNSTAYVAAAPGNVRVYPVRDAVVHTARVPSQARDVVVDPTRNRVYVGFNRLELQVYSYPGMTLERTVPLPFASTWLDLSADGDSLLIATPDGKMAVMDVNATTAPLPLALDGVTRVYGVHIASTGRAIALVRTADQNEVLLELDLATGARRVIATPDVPDEQEGVARSLDRRKLMLGVGCVFDVATESIAPCRAVRNGLSQLPMRGDATGTYWARYLDVFDASLKRTMRVADPDDTLYGDAVPLSDGGAYVSGARGLVRVLPNGVIAERLNSPPLAQIRMSDSGGFLAAWGATATEGYYVRVLDLR